MTTINPGYGLSSPAYLYEKVTYSSLLTEIFEGEPLWEDLMSAVDVIYDATVHFPMDQLYTMRSWKADLNLVLQNIAMMGYTVSLNNTIDPESVTKLYYNLGTFLKTKGASTAFLKFIGYVENTEFNYVPLWADSLTNTPTQLTDTPGPTIWNGGTYFPTPYFDVEYNEADYPNLDQTLLYSLMKPIIPIHLVLRSFVTSFVISLTQYAIIASVDEEEITAIIA